VNCLPTLIDSLRAQTEKDFEWVVADGASTDGTLDLLRSVTDLNIVISSQEDCGIYDALNRAIKMSAADYYVVAGADDSFSPDAIERFRNAIEKSQADIVTSSYKYLSRTVQVKNGPHWIFGQSSFIAGHSIATAFRKDLHRLYGSYSHKYPIAGDQLFVLSACLNGASICEDRFVAGNMGESGVSSVDRIGGATEVFRIQLQLGSSLLVQYVMLTLRIIRIVLLRK
jgi:glycosyltransferase involved in cell wall biosynthesis